MRAEYVPVPGRTVMVGPPVHPSSPDDASPAPAPPDREARHQCLIHRSESELREVVGPFVEEGLRSDRKILLVAPDRGSAAHRILESHMSVDWSGPRERDRIEFRGMQDAFGAGERFDRYRAISFVREAVAQARAEGFAGLHLIQELGSLGRGANALRDLTAYEAGLNLILADKPCSVLCLYDLEAAGSEVILRALELHPVSVGPGLQRTPNPFYQPEVELRLERGEELVRERLAILRRIRARTERQITHDPDALLARLVRRLELEGHTLDSVARVGIEEIGGFLEAERASSHLVDPVADVLVEGVGWPAFRNGGETRRTRGEGLAGRAWLARRPVWSANPPGGWRPQAVPVPTASPSAPSTTGLDPASGLALPLPGGTAVQGVLEFSLPGAGEPDEALLERLEPAARLLGEALARIRAETRAGRAGEGLGGLLANAGEGIVVTDPEGKIRSWNLAAAQILEEEGRWEVPVGRPLDSLLPPEARERFLRALAVVTGPEEAGPGASMELRIQQTRPDRPPISLSLTSWQGDGGDRCCVVAVRELPAPRPEGVDQRLVESLAGAGTRDPLLLLTGNIRWGGPSILHANPAFCRLLGFHESELLGRSLRWLAAPSHNLDPMGELSRQLASGEPAFVEFVARRRDGSETLLRMDITPVFGERGQVTHFVVLVPHRTAEAAVPEPSAPVGHDPLTGLATRELFVKVLRRGIERVRRNPELRFAVLFLDLDGFKEVNDELGHVRGDELLVKVARRLEEAVRPGDVLVRFGGDEFVILLEYVGGMADVVAVAERIQDRLGRRFTVDGRDLEITASIGIALSDTGYSSVEEVIRDADSAMYRAKEEGSGGYRIFDRTLREEARLEGQLRSDLQSSLDRGEFRLHYQPLMDLATGRISGLEVLLRWDHPERGLVAATEFITHAEATKLIVPLGEWVVRESCRQLRRWQDRLGTDFPLSLSLNLSAREVLDPRVHEWFEQSLAETGVAGSRLRVEVPESFFARPQAEVEAALLPLRALGVRIGIDEFGMGSVSIGQLHRLPVDFLKIDRRFVTDLPGKEGRDGRAVRAILAMADGLGLEVVAPGVETTLQEELLRELSCPTAQGYLFSAPVDAERAGRLLETGNLRRGA